MEKKALSLWILFIIPTIHFAQSNDYNLSNLLSFDGEPSIAVNPADPDNIISGWMRLRLDGKMWIATRTSYDGGASWSAYNFLPHIDTAYSSADVSIVFHNSGIAYLSYIDVDWSDTTATVFVTKSLDGGLTWETAVPVFLSSETLDKPIDRPWIAVDNSGGANDGAVYLTAMSLYTDTIYPHHVYLKTSTDSGNTWSNLIQVDDSLHSVGTLPVSWGTISVGGDGKAYIGYYSYDTIISPFLRSYAAVTEDLGASFTYSVVSNIFLTTTLDYFNGYVLTADPSDSNRVIMAWIDNRFGEADVVYSLSTDGGTSWSSPARINDDAAGNGIIQDRVWANYAADGALIVAWRDRRLNGTGTTVPADIYLSSSTDGGSTFSINYLMSDSSAPHVPLPCCNSFIDVASNDSTAYVIWGDDRSTDWEIYINSVQLPTGTNAGPGNRDVKLEIFPNPAGNSSYISFRLEHTQPVVLEVFGLSGKQLGTLLDEQLPTGKHLIDTGNFKLAPGTYIFRLTGKEFISQKLLVITD